MYLDHELKTREFQTQLLHYFSKSDNKSNHHHKDWHRQYKSELRPTKCVEALLKLKLKLAHRNLLYKKFPSIFGQRKAM